ncbi:hypothetical protein CKM354_000965100 [Cercospora kikuchii]|uniref:C2H2-type domain-containing protein n=1 Tax=Cercospora kikuchii TaxID=84275 RepID=A0A9P3CVJ4_9PEZI|nr:uncharacterized protein CKM354_000965100 [Cercospora kikuchii]GIZ46525.1 hypothetical protein CKM354_000965100 [Cercospora kikuchii]
MDCIPWKAIRARRSRDPTQAGWPDAMASIEDTVRLAKLQPVAIRPHSALPKNKLSALIDPADIPEGGHVRSPSGNLLDAMQFEARQDRPPCIRERQQRILARVRSQASVANAEQVAPFTQDADEKEFGNRTTIEAGKRRSDSDSAKSSDLLPPQPTTSPIKMSDTSEDTPRRERGIACTYADCQHRFNSRQEMKNHKIETPEHYYCKKCDVDCDDWDELLQHKVDMMAPFIEGRKRVRDEKPRHIVCEFCGENFKSFDGRKLHRTQMHPADQDIDCPGCQTKFLRATHMIGHIERDECKEIRRWMLHACINHKYILNQVMEGPDQFQHALSAYQQPTESFDLREVTDGSEAADQEQGGVSLIDQDDDAQMGGYRPMKPEVDLMDFRSGEATSASQGSWPKPKPQNAPKDLSDGMRTMSLGSKGTSRRGALKITTVPNSSATTQHSSANRKVVHANASSAWDTENTTKKLFPAAQPTPPAGDWKAIQEHRLAQNPNILDTHFWNPTDPNYSAERFYSPLLDGYCCPFPACANEAMYCTYKTPREIEQHFRDMHWIKMFRCPWCFKRFDEVTALMSHVEYTRKCRIKESRDFEKFIGEVTGGFLTAESVAQPKIFNLNKALVKAGSANVNVGVQSTKFSGALPNKGFQTS